MTARYPERNVKVLAAKVAAVCGAAAIGAYFMSARSEAPPADSYNIHPAHTYASAEVPLPDGNTFYCRGIGYTACLKLAYPHPSENNPTSGHSQNTTKSNVNSITVSTVNTESVSSGDISQP